MTIRNKETLVREGSREGRFPRKNSLTRYGRGTQCRGPSTLPHRLTALGVAQDDKIEVETQGRKIVEL
jgi:hypothetical protein